MFCTCVACVYLACLLLCKEEVSLKLLRGLTMPLLGFGKGIMLANFHMCGIMLVLEQFSTCS